MKKEDLKVVVEIEKNSKKQKKRNYMQRIANSIKNLKEKARDGVQLNFRQNWKIH